MSRWACNFERWQPTEAEWSAALALVSPSEQDRIGRFKRPTRHAGLLVGRHNPDAKSALVGRLLILLAAAHHRPHAPLDALRFERTPQGKPYLALDAGESAGPVATEHFNFNVSHAGEWVVLAAETTHLIGVDVMKVELRGSNPSLDQFFHDMRSCFTPLEWQHIRQASTDDAPQQLDRFFRHWTLKEAYIKAVGIGLGFDLQRAQFRCREVADGGGRGLCATATVEIDGAERREWTFELEYLDAHHLVAVARGPFAQALDGYRQAIGVPEEEEEEEVATEAHQAEKEERPYRAWRVWTFEELMRHIAQRQHEPRG
jgi:4'-phosphopantetheinyl transferase